MTVDHLKMLHTAGGKGKSLVPDSRSVRGVHSLAFGVLRERSEKVNRDSLLFRQEFGTFYLTRFVASLALKHFTVLAPGCSRGGWSQVSLAMCQSCEVNGLLATWKTQSFSCCQMFVSLTF